MLAVILPKNAKRYLKYAVRIISEVLVYECFNKMFLVGNFTLAASLRTPHLLTDKLKKQKKFNLDSNSSNFNLNFFMKQSNSLVKKLEKIQVSEEIILK
jgi:hypothetical protein